MNIVAILTTLCHVNVLQDGFQAIHFAASNGHAELVISLINNFEVEPQEKSNVRGIHC